MRTRFFLQSANYGRGFEMRAVSLNAQGEVASEAMPAVYRDVEAGAVWSAPFATITKDSAQNLMDELWALGVRPERGEMSVGQVAATDRHLHDMRAIAFAKLGVPKP